LDLADAQAPIKARGLDEAIRARYLELVRASREERDIE
jgi:hypothetical protein